MITQEEIIAELQKTIAQARASNSENVVYVKKAEQILSRLKGNGYGDLNQLMPSDELVCDLRLVGFHDIVRQLIYKGGAYGK